MSEQANELNFQGSEGADIYDFSWDIMTEDVVNAADPRSNLGE